VVYLGSIWEISGSVAGSVVDVPVAAPFIPACARLSAFRRRNWVTRHPFAGSAFCSRNPYPFVRLLRRIRNPRIIDAHPLRTRDQNNWHSLIESDRQQKLFISGSRQSGYFISNLFNIFLRPNGRACLLIDGLLLLFLYGPVVLLGSPLQLALLLGLRRGGYQRLALAGVAA